MKNEEINEKIGISNTNKRRCKGVHEVLDR